MRGARLFIAWCAAVVLAYGLTGWIGWALASPGVRKPPEGIRQQPAGYRTYTYWRGGK